MAFVIDWDGFVDNKEFQDDIVTKVNKVLQDLLSKAVGTHASVKLEALSFDKKVSMIRELTHFTECVEHPLSSVNEVSLCWRWRLCMHLCSSLGCLCAVRCACLCLVLISCVSPRGNPLFLPQAPEVQIKEIANLSPEKVKVAFSFTYLGSAQLAMAVNIHVNDFHESSGEWLPESVLDRATAHMGMLSAHDPSDLETTFRIRRFHLQSDVYCELNNPSDGSQATLAITLQNASVILIELGVDMFSERVNRWINSVVKSTVQAQVTKLGREPIVVPLNM